MKIGKTTFPTRPLFLAPMEDVTDIGFRMLCKRFGAQMVYTEFVSAEALVRSIKSTVNKLTVCDEERPVGIQIYGRDAEAMVEAAKIVEDQAHPDVIDINFGCPVKKVASKGAGAGMLQNIPKLLDITRQVVKAVSTPVTVKTRLGWSHEQIVMGNNHRPIPRQHTIHTFSRQQPCLHTHSRPRRATPGLRHTSPHHPRTHPFTDVHRRSRLVPHRRGKEQSTHTHPYNRKW